METSPAKTDVSLVTTLDRDVYRTNILINKRQQKFDMKMYYNPSSRKDMLHVYARYLNPRAIKAEAYTVANNRKSRIGLLTVNLKKNHLLNSAISWEPATKDKLKVTSAPHASRCHYIINPSNARATFIQSTRMQ